MTNITFNFPRGNTYTRDFTISGYDNPINNIYFTVKENEDDKRAVLQKKLNDGITIVDEAENSKTYNLLIKCTDTTNLKTNKPYYFDFELITNTLDGSIKKTFIKGTMTLETNITKPCNEY